MTSNDNMLFASWASKLGEVLGLYRVIIQFLVETIVANVYYLVLLCLLITRDLLPLRLLHHQKHSQIDLDGASYQTPL